MSAVSYAELERSRGGAIWLPEVADLGFTLKRGDALLVRGYRPFVLALEGVAVPFCLQANYGPLED
jgi:hypothetical protein